MNKKNPHWGTTLDEFLSEEGIAPTKDADDQLQNRESAGTPPLTMRDALHGIWQADKYPILGNEDWRAAARLDAEALERAATAVMSPGDRPEFAEWIAALRRPDLPGDERDEIMYAIHDLFEPEEG